jgi:hypothetical protein
LRRRCLRRFARGFTQEVFELGEDLFDQVQVRGGISAGRTCIAADSDARLAGLCPRIFKGDWIANRSHGPRRRSQRCFPRDRPLAARIWIFGQAAKHRLDAHTNGQGLSRVDEEARIQSLCGARMRQRRRFSDNSCASGTRGRAIPRFKKHDRKHSVTG